MRVGIFVAFMALAAVSLPVSAFSDPADSSAPAAASGTNPDEIICKTSAPPTGSRLGGGRECHTQRDWDQREKDARKALEEKQMHGLQSCLGSCGG